LGIGDWGLGVWGGGQGQIGAWHCWNGRCSSVCRREGALWTK
jgi:hypothetical protein